MPCDYILVFLSFAALLDYWYFHFCFNKKMNLKVFGILAIVFIILLLLTVCYRYLLYTMQ